MMNAGQKKMFENLFKDKKFFEVKNATYRAWLSFKIAAIGFELEVFNNMLATQTVTAIPHGKKRRMAGPSGAAKWDVANPENLAHQSEGPGEGREGNQEEAS